jgi:hypothetical protein
MTEPAPPTQRLFLRRFFGGLLVTVGVLMAGLAGLCTIAFLGMPGGGGDQSMRALVLVLGGPPIVIGAAMAWAGVFLWRKG